MVWLHSKITPPFTVLEAVARHRLIDSLQFDKLSKLTVVRAPAGYGKTTMLSQAVNQLDEPVAWLSLDSNDNDPMRFWTYVIRALSTAMDSDIISQFQEQAPLELIVDLLLNDISLIDEKLLFVIDDYHVIESQTIHIMMQRFIEYLPSNIRLVLTSRMDLQLPFAKWRVQGVLTEIGMEQLRFTYEETKIFYRNRKYSYENTESLRRLVEATEGWITGLQLAGLSNGTSIVDQPSSDYPFITEFLLQEIFLSLSPSEQDFLVRTSFLKQLEPAVCDVLTDRSDSYAMLLELKRKGLFIVRLHSGEPMFRYHHLFQDALKIEMHNRYSKNEIDSFFEKVAVILIERGDIVSGIELALRGGLWSLADKWITTYLVDIFMMGYVSAFIGWVELLRAARYSVHIETLVMYMIALSNMYEVEKARRLMSELEHRNKMDQWMKKDEYVGIASIFMSAKAFVIFAGGGDIDEAKQLIADQLKKGRVNSRWDHTPMQYNLLEAQTLRTSIGVRGKLLSKEAVLPFLNLFRQSGFKEQNMTGYGYGVQAETLYEHDHIEEALIELEMALQYGHRFQDPGLYIPMYILKSRIFAMKKKFAEAHSILDYAMGTTEESHWMDMLRVMKAHCHLLEDDLSEAERELSKSTGVYHLQAMSEQPFWLMVHARLLVAKGQAEEALKIILQIKKKALQESQVATIVEAGVLEAVCQMKLSNEEAALGALHGALKYGEMYTYKRTFLDQEDVEPLLKKYLTLHRKRIHAYRDFISTVYIEQLIVKNSNAELLNALKPREKDILNLVAGGYSNSDIAAQLYLSEGTVRVYLTTIYSKLGVSSRTQAMLVVIED